MWMLMINSEYLLWWIRTHCFTSSLWTGHIYHHHHSVNITKQWLFSQASFVVRPLMTTKSDSGETDMSSGGACKALMLLTSRVKQGIWYWLSACRDLEVWHSVPQDLHLCFHQQIMDFPLHAPTMERCQHCCHIQKQRWQSSLWKKPRHLFSFSYW